MIDLLKTRRSVPPHLLAAPAPEGDELALLLEIAARVPDHGKLAPWRFIVISGAARERLGQRFAQIALQDDATLDDKRLEIERRRLARAPLVIAVVSRAGPHVKIPEWEQVLSAGAVCMNLTIAANAMGYGTAWITEWIGYDRRTLDLIGVEAHEKLAGFVHIGTPVERPSDRVRPVIPEITTYLSE